MTLLVTIIDDEVTCECTQYQDLYKEGGRFFSDWFMMYAPQKLLFSIKDIKEECFHAEMHYDVML